MTKLLQERLRFRILRAILFVSNVSSLLLDVLIIIFGKKFIELLVKVQDADPISVRIFASIEAILCIIALFGIVRRHFITFALYNALLILYLLCAAVFTRVPVVWFFFLGLILVLLACAFSWMLYENKRQLQQRKQQQESSPYGI